VRLDYLSTESPFDAMVRQERLDELSAALNRLNPTALEILKKRFGLDDFNMMTLEQIAKKTPPTFANKRHRHLSRERIRQIIRSSLRFVRFHIEREDRILEKLIATQASDSIPISEPRSEATEELPQSQFCETPKPSYPFPEECRKLKAPNSIVYYGKDEKPLVVFTARYKEQAFKRRVYAFGRFYGLYDQKALIHCLHCLQKQFGRRKNKPFINPTGPRIKYVAPALR
jgi:hypothetical protein